MNTTETNKIIEKTYKVVVEFIKWHNEKKINKC
jgi:hypothetical protein